MKNATETQPTLITASDGDSGPRRENVRKSSSDGEAPSSGGQPGDNGLRRLAKAIYARIPAPLARALYPLIYCYRVYNEIRPRFWIAESQARDDGLSISVLCVAGTWDRSFLFGQVFGGQYRERYVGRAWLWNLSKVLAKEGQHCCAVVVRVRPGFRRLLGPQNWLKVPAWLVGDVDIPFAARILATNYVKNDLRKIRKNSLSFEVTRDIQCLDDFYCDMYLPYIAQTYQDGAIIASHDSVREEFPRCELLLVKQANEYVAGALVRHEQTGPSLWLVGIRRGDRQFVQAGAAGALYYFLSDYLVASGFTKLGLGKSRAFLHNGVLTYKRSRGMRVVDAVDGYFYLRTVQDTDASRAFLTANPLIVERDGVLYGAVFADANADPFSDKDFERLDKQFFMEGLSRLLVVPLGGSSFRAAVPPELAGRIAVCRASDLIL